MTKGEFLSNVSQSLRNQVNDSNGGRGTALAVRLARESQSLLNQVYDSKS